VYNLTDGERVSKRRFIEGICDGLGIERPRRSVPLWLARMAAFLMETAARKMGDAKPPRLTQAPPSQRPADRQDDTIWQPTEARLRLSVTRGPMKTTLILLLALGTLLVVPSMGFTGQDDRFERMRERAELRREMRERTRDRSRDRAEVRREMRRLREEVRSRVRSRVHVDHDHYRHEYRDAFRDAMREIRQSLRDALRDWR
jgi:hypothetical protein